MHTYDEVKFSAEGKASEAIWRGDKSEREGDSESPSEAHIVLIGNPGSQGVS